MSEDLEWVAARMGHWYSIKVLGTFGPEEGGQNNMVILNALDGLGPEGRVGPKHAEDIVKGMGLATKPKSSDIFGKEEPGEDDSGGDEMNAPEAKRDRHDLG